MKEEVPIRTGMRPAPEHLETLRRYLATLAPVPEAEWRRCLPALGREVRDAGETIQAMGQACSRIRFLIAGLARTSTFDGAGHEFTWALHFSEPGATLKNLFLVDYASFTRGEASALNIEAITQVEMLSISRDDIGRLYAESHFWADLGRRIADLAYAHIQHRALSLLALPARERYQQLLKESPVMCAVAPQHHIASYLGITPQSLSRLRRELGLTKCE